MTLHFGNIPAGTTLYIPFASYGKTNGESITLSGLAVTDIEIYKNGSTTQRSSDAGYALLDTDGIDFDGLTGIHGFSVDTSDNTDSGFYAVGSQYWVIVSSVTIDGQTVNFIAATFRLGPAEHTAGYPVVTIKDGTGTGEIDTASGKVSIVSADITSIQSGLALATDLATVQSDTNDIQSRLPAALVGGRMDASVGAMAANVMTAAAAAADLTTELQSGLATAADLATVAGYVDTEVAAIKAQTDKLTFDGANHIVADARKISTSSTAADNLEAGALAVVVSTCAASSTTTTVNTNLTEATDDHYNGRVIIFTSGALAGQASDITDYNGTTKALTVTALTEAPANSDAFVIV